MTQKNGQEVAEETPKEALSEEQILKNELKRLNDEKEQKCLEIFNLALKSIEENGCTLRVDTDSQGGRINTYIRIVAK